MDTVQLQQRQDRVVAFLNRADITATKIADRLPEIGIEKANGILTTRKQLGGLNWDVLKSVDGVGDRTTDALVSDDAIADIVNDTDSIELLQAFLSQPNVTGPDVERITELPSGLGLGDGLIAASVTGLGSVRDVLSVKGIGPARLAQLLAAATFGELTLAVGIKGFFQSGGAALLAQCSYPNIAPTRPQMVASFRPAIKMVPPRNKPTFAKLKADFVEEFEGARKKIKQLEAAISAANAEKAKAKTKTQKEAATLRQEVLKTEHREAAVSFELLKKRIPKKKDVALLGLNHRAGSTTLSHRLCFKWADIDNPKSNDNCCILRFIRIQVDADITVANQTTLYLHDRQKASPKKDNRVSLKRLNELKPGKQADYVAATPESVVIHELQHGLDYLAAATAGLQKARLKFPISARDSPTLALQQRLVESKIRITLDKILFDYIGREGRSYPHGRSERNAVAKQLKFLTTVTGSTEAEREASAKALLEARLKSDKIKRKTDIAALELEEMKVALKPCSLNPKAPSTTKCLD